MGSLEVEIAGVKMQNPVLPASGTFEFSRMHENYLRPEQLGAVINKTIYPNFRPGNAPSRIFETPCGMLNSVGIPTEGLDHFLRTKLPTLVSFGVPVIVSIAGNTLEEFNSITSAISDTGKADMIELDLSCPNLEDGTIWASEKEQLFRLVQETSQRSSVPIIAKLSPQVSDIADMASAAEQAGAGAVSLVNTFRGMKIDIDRQVPVLGSVFGGLSGPAILPMAVYAVWQVYERVSIPIFGMGGIHTTESALEFILAGASAVAVGMYNFVNPGIMKQIIQGMEKYLQVHEIASITELIGQAHKKKNEND